MSNYRIFETDEFIKKLGKINPPDKDFIEKKLQSYIYPQIKNEPHFGKNIRKLVNYDPEIWRYRIGRFRLFYTMKENEKIIYILTVELRKIAYR